ncbi:hypothetical protein [Salinigranum salinum]|uniref:hypothetical protein n=1 Tax=Salinigranum salinum TaxID=1364937 RepID=UPI001260CDC1|nr:hypothetical protein [Salinigranum salinum]
MQYQPPTHADIAPRVPPSSTASLTFPVALLLAVFWLSTTTVAVPVAVAITVTVAITIATLALLVASLRVRSTGRLRPARPTSSTDG